MCWFDSLIEHASPNVTGVQVITGYCSEAGVINCASHSDEISKEGMKTNL